MKSDVGRPGQQRSVTATLGLWFLAFSAVVLAASGGLHLLSSIRTQQEAITHYQQLVAQDAATAVRNFLQDQLRVLETTAWLSDLTGMSHERQQQTLRSLLGFQPSFRQLIVMDVSGQELARASRLSMEAARRITGRLSGEVHERIREAKRYISPVYVDLVTAEPWVIVAVRTTNALGEVQGVLMADVNLKFMWDVVDRLKVGEAGRAYVVDGQGALIAYGDTARVLQGERVAGFAAVRDFLKNPRSTRSDRTSTYVGISGTRVVGTYAALGMPDWAVVTEVPWSEAYRYTIRDAGVSVGITLAMAIAAGALGVCVSRRLTVPLVQLTNTATRIAEGERELLAVEGGPKEMSRLASAFNSMTAQLRASLDDLERRLAEQRETEAALRVSEGRLRSALEGTTSGIWDWNIQTENAYFSPRYYTMLGYEVDEFPATYESWHGLLHPDDAPAAERVLHDHLARHIGAFAIEFRMKAKDGQWRWILSRGAVVDWDSDGKAVRVAGAHMDITERKRAEAALRDSEDKYKRLIETTHTGYVIMDDTGRVTDANQEYVRMTGHERLEDIVGRSVLDWTAVQDRERNAAEVRSCLERGWVRGLELDYINAAGRVTPLEVNATVIHSADGVQILSLCRDITERKRAEAALERAHLLLEAVLDQSPVPVAVASAPDLVVRYANRAAADFLGVSDEPSFVGMTLTEVERKKSWRDFRPDGTPVSLLDLPLARALRGETVRDEEYSVIRKDGTRRWELASGTPVYSHDGDLVAGVIAFLDITERRATEEALRAKTEELDRYFTHALDLLCIADTDGYFRRLNKQWESALGYTIDELEGTRFLDYIHPDDVDATLRAVKQLDAKQEVLGFVNRYRAKDGSYRWIEWRSSSAGKPIYAVARDITDRKQAEDALRARTQQLEALRQVTAEITHELDLARLLKLIHQRAAALLGVGAGFLALYDEATQTLVPQSWEGHGDWVGNLRFRLGEGVSGKVAAQRQGMVVNDYRTSGDAVPLVLEQSCLTSIVVEPLLYRGRLVGVVTVDDSGMGRRTFTEDDRRLLGLFAAHAAVAIENARLYEAAQRELAERTKAETTLRAYQDRLEALLHGSVELAQIQPLEQLIGGLGKACARLLQADGGDVRIVEGPDLVKIASWGDYEAVGSPTRLAIGRGLSGTMAARGEPMIVNNLAEDARIVGPVRDAFRRLGHRAWLGVPVKHGDHLLATLNMWSREHFSPEDIAIATAFAAQAAIALENARLYSEVQRELAERIRAEEALRASEAFLSNVIEHSPYSTWVSDSQGTLIRLNQVLRDTLHITDEDVVGRYNVFQDAQVEEQGLMPLVKRVFEQGETVRFPMRYDGARLQRGGAKQPTDLILDLTMSPVLDAQNQVANVIIQHVDVTERVRAQEALRARTQLLEAVRAFSEEITQELDLATLLSLIARRAMELLGAPKSVVFLWDDDAGSLLPCAWQGYPASDTTERATIRLRPGEGVAGAVVERRQGMIVNDYGASVYAYPPALDHTHPTAVLAEPLHIGDRLVGVLLMQHEDAGRRFGTEDQETVRLFAAQAAIAIENARLYQDEQGRRKELEAVRAVSEELVRELDLTVLLRVIHSRAAALAEADNAVVWLWDEAAQVLTPKSWQGFGAWLADARMRPGEGVTGMAAARKAGIMVNDFRTSPYATPFWLEHSSHVAVIAEPLLYRDRLVGAIAVTRNSPEWPFLADDQQRLHLFAAQAAIAIANAQLFDAAQREINDRKRAEEKLSATLQQMHDIIEFLPDPTFVIDQNGRVIAWNQAMEQLSGKKTEDILGQGDYAYALPFYGERRPMLIDLIDLTGSDSETRYAYVDRAEDRIYGEAYAAYPKNGAGAYLWGVASPLYDGEGRRTGAIEVIRDITDRKRAEDALRESQTFLEAVFEHSPYSMWASDDKGTLIRMNQACRDLLRTTDDALVGRYNIFRDNIVEQEGAMPLVRRVFERGERVQFTLHYDSARLSTVPLQDPVQLILDVTISPVINAQKRVIHAVIQHQDITERTRAAERLQASLREKEALLREVHHRVKNNMQVISSLLRLQSRQIKTPAIREIFRESQNRVRSMALVHELLYQSQDLARINLRAYFKSLAQGMYRAYGADTARIALAQEVDEILVGADVAIPCGLVVGELLSNAFKHAFPAPRAGTIRLRARPIGESELEVTVKDDGVGMDPEQSRGSAESLGLRLVHMLAEDQLHGVVQVLRQDGTECRLRFPMEKR